MTNRLSKETSPYLLQHQKNPVDWYPWGPEALQRALTENKPILLSVGYSACHWCHVMEHESFENLEVAQLMNENFINIKVDREERPDLDHIYQNVAQVMTQGGGWPLTVFLTPELKPFYGGTYFPPEDRYGRPGFKRVLVALANAFRNDAEVVKKNADKLAEMVTSLETITAEKGKPPEPRDLQDIAQVLLTRIDWEAGGLGGAPKFPNTMILAFLWRLGNATSLEKACEATLLSLVRMASGGIYDQLGGGFHRYSVDATWSVPHFEKMLYDNALLLKLYSEVLLSGSRSSVPISPPISYETRELFQRVIRETTHYIYREMISPDGVFYSAQDADSEGEEGKFFVWDKQDLAQILTQEESFAFALRYGVTETGNFEHGKTVLYLARSVQEVSKLNGLSEAQTKLILESACKKLLAARSSRITPALDNKVLTGWNALMISGLAWASQAFRKDGQIAEADRAIQVAEKAFHFLKSQSERLGNRLFSSFQGGKTKGNGFLDDYAFMAMAALDLSRFTRNADQVEDYQEAARQWIGTVLKHFGDSEGSAYFFTSDDHEKLIQRPKTIFDQAIPSGTAVALSCMEVLGQLDLPKGQKEDQVRFEQEVGTQIASLFASAKGNPYGLGELLCSVLLRISSPIVVSGSGAGELCTHPHIFRNGPKDSIQNETSSLDKPGSLSEPDLLVCHRQTCSLPLETADAIQLISQKLSLGISS